jgi:YbbR domain-containing protein
MPTESGMSAMLLRLWRLLSRNLAWKIAALLASTALWMAINGSEPNADRYLRLGVSPFGLSKRLAIANRLTGTVEVQIRGPRSILRTIDEEAYRVPLDLRGLRVGAASVKLPTDLLSFPRRVKVIRITPARVDLRIERLTKRSLPVKAVLVPGERNGYTISDLTVNPAQVEVSGPAGRIAQLQSVETEPVSTINAKGSVEREAALAGAGEWLSFFPDTVHVAFTVNEAEGERVFQDLPIAVRNADAAARVEPETVALTLRGPQRPLAALQLSANSAYVDVAGLGPGEHRLTVGLTLPDGIDVEVIEPEEVRVTIAPAEPAAQPRDETKR